MHGPWVRARQLADGGIHVSVLLTHWIHDSPEEELYTRYT